MADISLCNNVDCPSRKYCRRATAKPSEVWQSYTNFSLEDDEDNCSYFLPNGVDDTKCKRGGVKREGEICNLEYCSYPKCTQESYCTYCHKTEGDHKMSCETRKIQVNL